VKHLPCIPDEVVSKESRQRLYNYEQNIELITGSGRVLALVDPRLVAGNYRELISTIDALSEAYLRTARERDQWKGVCELASDDYFWEALEALKNEYGPKEEPTTERPGG